VAPDARWLKPLMRNGSARIRGLGFGACVSLTNLGLDKQLMVELLARLCVDKIGRFY
jgi:hypothetical protein